MVAATANTPQSLPRLKCWYEWVREVEKMMAERWASGSGRRCGGGSRENAALLDNGNGGAALHFALACAREGEVQERNEVSIGVARLISPS